MVLCATECLVDAKRGWGGAWSVCFVCSWLMVVVGRLCLILCGVTLSIVSVPERSKGVDSSSTVFALVGSNPTADTISSFTHHD